MLITVTLPVSTSSVVTQIIRFGIDSLAAIIERRFHMHLFVPNTLFLFCGRSSTKIKGLLWEGDDFLLLYERVESGHFT